MKIRTFFICESIESAKDNNALIINKMLLSLSAKTFPHEDNIVMGIVFDEVEEKPVTLNIALLNSKDKPLATWSYTLKASQISASMKFNVNFTEAGLYNFKISYDDNVFLGKYPLLLKGGEKNE